MSKILLMRVSIISLLIVLIPISMRGEAGEMGYSHLTPGGKINLYLKSSVDPVSIAGGAFSAGFNQAIDSVPEWGQGMEGFGKRFASSRGKKAVDQAVCYSLKILLQEDPRYFYSGRQGVRARTIHALGETFVAHKDSGGTRPNYSLFAGTASGVYVSRQWYPERDRTVVKYVQGVAISIGAQSAKNVFMEFWPDIKKKFFKR